MRRWLLIGPLLLMAIGLVAASISSQLGWTWPPLLALGLPDVLLVVLVVGALAWLATGPRKSGP